MSGDASRPPGSVSVVVLNFNGGDMVLDCLRSVRESELQPLEVICVDNASQDRSLAAVAAAFPEVRIVALPVNTGFVGGMNRGIDESRGEFVALLNLDVTLDRSYLGRCRDALAGELRLGGVTGKLLRPDPVDPPILDTTGHTVYRNRRAVDRGEREPDVGQYDNDSELFSVCAAAVVYRRAMLDDVALDGQYFDDDFFAYFEDFDLSWRAQLRGWSFAYVPGARGRHHRGGSDGKASTRILACNHRNRLLVMVRNDAGPAFFRHFAGIVYTELRATLHMASLRPAALLRAWIEFFRLLPRQIRKRRRIQRQRTVSWRELEPWFVPYDYRLRTVARRAKQRAAVR